MAPPCQVSEGGARLEDQCQVKSETGEGGRGAEGMMESSPAWLFRPEARKVSYPGLFFPQGAVTSPLAPQDGGSQPRRHTPSAPEPVDTPH